MHIRKKRGFKSVVIRSEKISFFLVSVFVFISAFLITRTNLLASDVYKGAIGSSVPAFKAEMSTISLKKQEFNSYSLLSHTIPAIYANTEMQKKYAVMFSGSIKAKKAQNEDKTVELKNGVVREVNSSGGMTFNNATEYAVNANELLSEGFSMDTSANVPKVLIISTHSSEAYSNSAGGRSEDENQNVLKVGEVLCDTLNKAGVKTIHDKTRNDYPSYNGSYKKALTVIEENLKKYPSIEMVIDVHRDYMETADGVRLKPTANLVGGQKAAQIMFVIGTDAMGLEHPNWRENLRLSVKVQNILNSDAPGLCRSVNIRTERFNQHMTRGSMIVEFGSSENTLEEAKLSAKLLGEAIAKAVK